MPNVKTQTKAVIVHLTANGKSDPARVKLSQKKGDQILWVADVACKLAFAGDDPFQIPQAHTFQAGELKLSGALKADADIVWNKFHFDAQRVDKAPGDDGDVIIDN